jgi:acyl-CoA thioesterase I
MGFVNFRVVRVGSGRSPRSYGKFPGRVKIGAWATAVIILCVGIGAGGPARAADPTVKIVALGDSLTAGFGLRANEAFPVKLQKALVANGQNVNIVNAGVSGDTASGGLGRLDWSVPEGTDGVIIELGANDALRGVDPKITRKALNDILGRLAQRKIPVLLCGMLAPRNLDDEYRHAFDSIYPDLAAKYGAILYPFFLDGVALETKLNQHDGLHPTAAGVDVIVKNILPAAEALVAKARAAENGASLR